MENLKDKTEQELRETDVEWPETKEELMNYIDELVERDHDYGTCVYAMSIAAVATFYYVSKQLGVTGFQANCADMDILRRTRSLEDGFMIIDYSKLLYPQYFDDEHFPTKEQLLEERGEQLAEKAKQRLEESNGDVAPAVKKHWQKIVYLYG
jgi:hypothetical protein